jgi:hypothetical protein
MLILAWFLVLLLLTLQYIIIRYTLATVSDNSSINGGSRSDNSSINGGSGSDGSSINGGSGSDGSSINGGSGSDGSSINGGSGSDGSSINGGSGSDGSSINGGSGSDIRTMGKYCTVFKQETDLYEFKTYFTDVSLINSFLNGNASKFLKSGYWIFNPITIKTIKNYLKLYLPRYIASFSHPLCTSKRGGEFYIGIDDKGIMHGIPYKGELKINFNKIIDKLFQERLMSVNDECIDAYKKQISVEIIKLDIDPKYKHNERNVNYKSEQYKYYLSKLNTQEDMYNKYLSNKKKWEFLFNKYTGKLHDLINSDDFRLEIIDYIKTHSNKHYDLIADLRTNKKYRHQTYTEISKIKDDSYSVFYWIIRFKDARISFLKNIKPKCPKLYYNDNTPSFLLCNTPLMIPTWLERNKSLNLYIIKINISGNISPTKYLKYKDKITKKWRCCYRTMHDHAKVDFPRCEPIQIKQI